MGPLGHGTPELVHLALQIDGLALQGWITLEQASRERGYGDLERELGEGGCRTRVPLRLLLGRLLWACLLLLLRRIGAVVRRRFRGLARVLVGEGQVACTGRRLCSDLLIQLLVHDGDLGTGRCGARAHRRQSIRERGAVRSARGQRESRVALAPASCTAKYASELQ